MALSRGSPNQEGPTRGSSSPPANSSGQATSATSGLGFPMFSSTAPRPSPPTLSTNCLPGTTVRDVQIRIAALSWQDGADERRKRPPRATSGDPAKTGAGPAPKTPPLSLSGLWLSRLPEGLPRYGKTCDLGPGRNSFVHACPRCAERLRRERDRSSKRWRVLKRGPVGPLVGNPVPRCRLYKRPLVRIGNQQEELF